MIKNLTLLVFFLMVSSVSFCQDRITEILRSENPNTVVLKELGENKYLLKITPDQYLKVYKIQDENLILIDEKYYPDLYYANSYEITKNFFLISNEKGSIAYDFRDNSEFVIPYENGNYITTWSVNNLEKDLVTLTQFPSNFTKTNIDLKTKEISPAPNNERIQNLTENIKRISRYIENTDGGLNEYNVLTNLVTQDSIVLNTGVLYSGYADFNDHSFLYSKQNQIIKVNNDDFTVNTIMEVPEGETFKSLFLADEYSIIVSQNIIYNYNIRVFDTNNQLIITKENLDGFEGVYNYVINNHILFSGKNKRFTSLNLSNGNIKEELIKYSYDMHNLNDSYLLSYAENKINLISKENLSIKSKNFVQQFHYIPYISSIENESNHLLSFGTNNEGENPLFIINGDTILNSPILMNETTGITSHLKLWDGITSDKLLLADEDIYSFDQFGYNKISENPMTKLYVNGSLKINKEQTCWAESTPASKYQVNCFKNDEVHRYGTIQNITDSLIANPLYNYSVNGDDLLYLYKSPITSDIELRIKKNGIENDSLIKTFNLTNDMKEINQQAFFRISDSLYTYDHQKDALVNLGIPVKSNFSSSNFISHKGKTYLTNGRSVFEIDGINTTLINEVPEDQYLSGLKSFGDYLLMNSNFGYYSYDETSLNSILIPNNHVIKYLGNKYLAYYENNNMNTLQPVFIYNLDTQQENKLIEEYDDRAIEFVFSINGSPIMITQNRINGLNTYSIDRFDEEFNNYSNITSIPKIIKHVSSSKLIESEDFTIVVLGETIFYFDNLTGEIADMVTVLGLVEQHEAIYKDNILYFIKYDTDLGRQVFMYDHTISSDLDFQLTKFELYPNPTENILTIKSPETIQLWNLLSSSGRVLMSSDLQKTQVDINVNHLPTGVYFIEITTGGKKGIQKFIKI